MKVILLAFIFFAANVQAQINSDFEKAKSSFELNHLDEAYIHLKNGLQKDDSHLPSKILMGKILALSFYYDEAILEFEDAIAAGADRNLIIEYYANSLIIKKRFDDLVVLSDKNLSPKNRSFLKAVQAKAFNALGNSEKASSLFKEAITLDASNPNILVSYARYLAQNENSDEAMSYILKALDLDALNTEAIRIRAALYRDKGEFDLYLTTLEQAIEIDNEQPLVLRDLITAYISKSEYEKSKVLLERVLTTAPNDPMAKFLFSWVSINLGDIETANQTLEELVNNLSLIDEDTMQNADGLTYISGMANYAAGNMEAANVELNKYLSKRPNDLNASVLLSEIYVREGNFASAVKLLERFQSLALDDLEFGSKLCDLYIQANANHKCNWLVLQMSKKFDSNPEFLTLKAKSLAARGKPEDALNVLSTITNETEKTILDKALLSIESNQLDFAIQQINKLRKIQKDNNDYKNLLASVYIKQGKMAEAENILNDILAKNNSHYSARFNLASVKFRQQKYRDTLEITEKLLVERSAQINVMLLQGKTLRQLNRKEEAMKPILNSLSLDSSYSEAKFELAELYIDLGELDNALTVLNQLLKDNFLNSVYLSKRAQVFIAKKNYTDAKQDLTLLFSAVAKKSASLMQVAYLQKDAQDFDGALKSIDTAIQLAPKEYSFQREKARLLLQTGQVTAAKEQITQLRDSFDRNADTYLLMGDLAGAEENFTSAAKHYDDAIVMDNGFNQALVKRYQLAQQGFETAKFATLYESIIQDNEDSDLTRNLLADYYSNNKMNDEAKAHYLAIIKHDSYAYLAVVMNNLANIYLIEGNYNTAHELARKAHNKKPNNQAIMDTLGWSLANLNRYDEALNYLRQSYSMNTADAAVRYHLGYVLAKLGRIGDAKKELQNLLEQFGDFDDRSNAENLLENL